MQRHLLDLVSGLLSKGYEVEVISAPNPWLSERLNALGIAVTEFQLADRLSPGDVGAIRKLAKHLRRHRPDILHAHGNKAQLVGIPAAHFARLPTVATVHNFLSWQEGHPALRLLASWVRGRLVQRTDKVIAVSGSLKENLLETAKIEPEKVVVIHNGIDIERWRGWQAPQSIHRGRLGVREDQLLIVSVGRLVHWKGHDPLIRALARLAGRKPQIRAMIAGEGPEKPKLEELVAAVGLQDRVEMLGRVGDIRPLLAAADIFALPSLKEPFGIVLLEAMAAGLPILATNQGGVSEIITDGLGVLVPPNDEQALADGLELLIDDAPYRERLGRAALAAVRERFSLERAVEETEKVYQEIGGQAWM